MDIRNVYALTAKTHTLASAFIFLMNRVALKCFSSAPTSTILGSWQLTSRIDTVLTISIRMGAYAI